MKRQNVFLGVLSDYLSCHRYKGVKPEHCPVLYLYISIAFRIPEGNKSIGTGKNQFQHPQPGYFRIISHMDGRKARVLHQHKEPETQWTVCFCKIRCKQGTRYGFRFL